MADKWESFSEISVEVPSGETNSFDDTMDQGDTSALLPGGSTNRKEMPSMFSVAFYQRCWDVTTNEVRLRIKSAVYPRQDFISGLHGKPDLYGPFWVAVTLCFSTAICGNLANFVQNQGNPLFKYTPEFERVTSAASAIFGYAFIFPFLLSVVLYYSKIMTGFSTIELLTAYGYSLSIFVPISFLWVVPVEFIRWGLVIVGAVVSGAVVGLPIWRGVKQVSNKKLAYGILSIVVGANVALAVGFKLYFFESPLLMVDGTEAPTKFVEPMLPEAALSQDIVETAEIENPAEAAEEPEVEEVHVVEAQVQEVGADVPENPEPAVEAAVEPVEEAVEVVEETEEEKVIREEKVESVLKGLPRAPAPEELLHPMGEVLAVPAEVPVMQEIPVAVTVEPVAVVPAVPDVAAPVY